MTRRQHYSDLYDGPVRDGRPLAVVHGNCQAEALRILLAASPTFGWQTARVPPVHELEQSDLEAYDRLLAASTLLLSQPVAQDYRGLPLGAQQVTARLAPGGVAVIWPVVLWKGLHPWQATVRAADGAEPPVVPYHDLRTLTGRAPEGADLLTAARESTAELARREAACDVAVSDVVHGGDAVHTLNHPGNRVMVELARRVQAHVGAPVDATDRERELLGGVRAPLEAQVLTGLGLDTPPREHWLVDGQEVPAEDVAAAHAAWYATRPDVVAEGLRRYAALLPVLGLA